MKSTAILLSLAFSMSAFAETPPVPRPARELTILEPSGKETLLSKYRGKVCVIQFLFTTCPHCQNLSRELTKLQNDLGPKGVQVLGVAFDDGVTAAVAQGYVQRYGVGFPVGYAKRDTVLNYLGISLMNPRFVVPQVMIVDQKGVVRAQSEPMGTEELYQRAYLEKFVTGLLKGAPAPASAPKAPAAKAKDSKKS